MMTNCGCSLISAGGFIKYHSLKQHDIFTVYEDGCKKLVSASVEMFAGQ